jgi:hypothetical protein
VLTTPPRKNVRCYEIFHKVSDSEREALWSVFFTRHFSGYHVWETKEVHAEFWWGDLRGKRDVGRPRCRSEGTIKNRYLRNGMRKHGLD